MTVGNVPLSYLIKRMTDGDVPFHRYCHGEVGGPSQPNLTDGEQLGEQLVVHAVGPDTEKNYFLNFYQHI